MAKDEKDLLDAVLILLRHVHRLCAAEDAMLKMLEEIRPLAPPEIQAVLKKYESYKRQMSDEVLLELEKTLPWLAAHLDKENPLISPDEQNDS